MVVDLFLVYQFIRRLATPFNKWKAFDLGIIDKDGKVLIKRKNFTKKVQSDNWGTFDIMIANLKKLLAKIPGGGSKLASYAAALFLIKEFKAFSDDSLLNEDMSDEQLDESIHLFSSRYNYYTTLNEDVNSLNEKAELFLEKLKASDDMGDWIDDFYKSDAPQFKGKSKEKRRQMAIAAKLAVDESLEEAAAPRWKRAGNNGEIQATIGGEKYQIEKALDHNERHKGEWKVMVWDKRRSSWEWETTEYGKANAKDWIMDRLKESATNMRTLKLIDKIKKSGVVKSGSMAKKNIDIKPEIKEEPTNNVGTGNIAGMDAGHMSKAAQKKWTKSNKTKKKKLRDIMGVPKQ